MASNPSVEASRGGETGSERPDRGKGGRGNVHVPEGLRRAGESGEGILSSQPPTEADAGAARHERWLEERRRNADIY